MSKTLHLEWQMVSLGELLKKSEEWVEIESTQCYQQVTVRMWGQGVVLRCEISGTEISARRMLVVHPEQFIISRIDARNGASGLIPHCLDGAVVTNDFPVFIPNSLKILPQFLAWMSKTHAFVDLCKAASEGTTNRVRLKEDRFLSMQILLPPLEEQRRIVARIEELVGKVEEARELRSGAIEEVNAIVKAFQQKFFTDGSDVSTLGEVSVVIDPNPSHRYPVYWERGIPMISTVNFVGEDEISTTQAKHVTPEFYDETLSKFAVGEGDVIFSRKGKVGYARPHPPNIKLAMTHTLCVIQPNRDKILPRYLLYFTRSLGFINYLMGTMNPNSGVPTLGLGVIRSAPMHLPSFEEQHRIVAHLDNLQTKVDNLKRLQSETESELNALIPSILDKAFKGEL